MRDDDAPPPARTSGILRDLAAGLPGERVTLGEIDAALADRAFGLLMLVFALPNTLPSLPGMSAVLGMP
ncbi:MAG: exopolysaccharide biosynthesis protein, partial [Alphaproteobacteria bacterium]|nr:exopolysaccharide biosynthesis protein [Alphaproteobacteria bacterium]